MSSKAWRWTKRITLGVIAFVVLAVTGVLIFLHTDYGRNIARSQVEARMNAAFVGGASIGSLEGSVVGTMVLHDVVINGPDKKPAIKVKKLSLGLGILPLFTKQARVKDVVAEGVDIDLRRDPDGQLQTAHMVKANDEKSGWAVQIPSVLIKDAHLHIQGVNGAEDTNIDHMYLSGGVYMPADGAVRANVAMMAKWRERDVPMWLDVSVRNDTEVLTVGSLLARIGDVQVTAAGVRMIKPNQPGLLNPRPTPMILSGLLAIDGTRAAIMKLLPGVDVPVDNVDIGVVIAPRPLEPWTHVTLRGSVDREPVHADIDVDLDARRARGFVSTGRVNLTRITKGRIEGTGSAMIAFDGLFPRDPDVLPVGGIMAHAGGDIMGLQNALATIAVTSTGEQAAATITAVSPGASVQLGGQVKKHGDRLVLESGRVLARVVDPSRVTKGKAPVRGSLSVDATASGVLSPKLDLSVSGLVVGSRLRAKDLRVGSVKLAIAGSHLPSRPIGKAELKARDVERGNVFLRELDLDAANREDGKIAVTMRTRPRNDPWLIEADALVTPGDTVVVDLLRHKVRVATGTEWTGDSGQIVIGKQRVDIRDVSTTSKDGAIAVAGELQRATGNFKAHVEVAQFALNSISKAYAGTLGARIDVERTNGRFAGVVDMDAHGVVISPKALPLDGYARIEAAADKLVIDATANNKQLGTIDFDLDLDAPKNITNVEAWKRLRRSDIRSGQLQLTGIDAGRIAQLANVPGQYGGRIDGDIRLSATTAGGLVQIKELYGPALKNLGPLSANVTITQTGPTTLQPTLVATIDDRKAAGNKVNKPLAKIEAQATLGAPDRLFDPAAWQQLGAGAFEGATVKVEDVLIEPPLLDRLQVTTNMRGRASFDAQIAAKLEGVKAQLALRDLRGSPLEAPVSVDIEGEIDNVATTATLAMTSPRPFPQRLLDVRARIPVSLDALRANPRAFRDAKLEATITLPEVPASRVASTFGRSQITGGLLHGTIEITGTVAKPLVKARIAGTKIAVPPGPRGKPIKTIDRLSLNADWDGTSGKLDIDATQEAGSLSLDVQGNPKQLDAATLAFSAKAFDIMPLLAFAPGPAGGAAGRLDGKLAITGLDPRRMKIAGDLHLTNGRVPIAPAIGTLRRAKIDVVVGKELAITVDGKLGGGDLRANAKLGLDGAMPTGGDAKIELRKTSPIGTVEPEISADITAKLTRRPDAWVTDIKVAHGWVKVPGGRGEKLDPVGRPDDMIYVTQQKKLQAKAVGEEHRPARPSFIANIVIDPTFVESTELRGYLKGNLKIQSDADTMGVVGTIEAVRGDLDLFGRRYQLDRAVVRFDGSTDPLLDIVVTHDFPEVTTRTAVRGRLSKPELMMSANPNTYSQGQLLGFLLGGEPAGQPADGNPRDQALSAGASIVANKITGYVKQALPIDIDVLRYESATAASGAAVTVGTWLSRSLFVAYRRRIEARPDENSGEGEIEYWLTRRVVVEGVVGDRGFNGVDLLWRKRY